MSTRRTASIAGAVSFMLWSAIAHALVFQEHNDRNGVHVLIVRDCPTGLRDSDTKYADLDGRNEHGPICREGGSNDGFTGSGATYAGDEVVLDYILNLSKSRNSGFPPKGAMSGRVTAATIRSLQSNPKPFAEVWLNSGGGDVDAGIGIARTLRKHHMAVHLPDGYQCISSCTLAFMGGVLRYIDEHATYRVHSASSWTMYGEIDDGQIARIKSVMTEPDRELREIARDQQYKSRYMAVRMMTSFQNSLIFPLGVPQRAEKDSEFCAWAGGEWVTAPNLYRYVCIAPDSGTLPTHFAYLDGKSAERDADAARLKREGVAALQDVIMRLESEAMVLAISDLQASLSERGPRASAALNMVREMFITSIKDTNYLTQNQMITMGYITPVFHDPK